MRVELTTDAAAAFIAKEWLSYQYPSMRADLKPPIEAVKYNVLATAFNLSTVLLTIAVAAVVFSTASTAVLWGAIGMGLRFIAEKEITKYAVPSMDREDPRSVLTGLIRSSGVIFSSKADLIFHNCKIAGEANWEENDGIFLDYVAWKNLLPTFPVRR